MNVYDSDFTWPEGAKVKAFRIVQLFPKATPTSNRPNGRSARITEAERILSVPTGRWSASTAS